MGISFFAFILTISIVVVFHEYGHYLAARYYGVHVERFSLGFGKVLYRYTDKNETEWVISLLPLGGYVKPLAEPRPQHPKARQGESIEEKTPWQKIVIYAAGPAFSFLLGILIYICTLMLGEEKPVAVLATPPSQSLVDKAGIKEGDKIRSINQQAIAHWDDFAETILPAIALGKTVHIQLERKEGTYQEVELSFPVQIDELSQQNLLKKAGFILKSDRPSIQKVLPQGPAELAGLQAGDQLMAFNRKPINDLQSFMSMLQQNQDKAFELLIERQHQSLSFWVKPQWVTLDNGEKVVRIQAQLQANYPMVYHQENFWNATIKAFNKTLNTALSSFQMIGKIITGQASIKNLSGPISIADYSGEVAKNGALALAQFIALISISIGVLNLLPIPGLDGGQMLIHLLTILRGKPLSENAMQTVMKMGYGILFAIMVLAFSNDIMRLLN